MNKLTMKNLLRIILLLLLLTAPGSAMASQLKGDINGDGRVNIADVSALIDFMLSNSADTVQMAVYDMNNDGFVNIADVSCLIDALLNPTEPIPTTDVVLTVNGVSFTMVLVDGGQFVMGATDEQQDVAGRNEYPAHEVTLWSYYIGQTEVTQELWEAVMGENPSGFTGDPKRPVENVNLFDCAKFVDLLTELTGKTFRMPTEAEWEFAARGGNMSRHYRYAGGDVAGIVAWCETNAGGMTHAVALKAPNELGLYDMSGNVCEWCQDWYTLYDAAPQTNPVGPESGTDNVYRGGSWLSHDAECRVSSRYNLNPHEKSLDLGLRIVMNY